MPNPSDVDPQALRWMRQQQQKEGRPGPTVQNAQALQWQSPNLQNPQPKAVVTWKPTAAQTPLNWNAFNANVGSQNNANQGTLNTQGAPVNMWNTPAQGAQGIGFNYGAPAATPNYSQLMNPSSYPAGMYGQNGLLGNGTYGYYNNLATEGKPANPPAPDMSKFFRNLGVLARNVSNAFLPPASAAINGAGSGGSGYSSAYTPYSYGGGGGGYGSSLPNWYLNLVRFNI